MRIRVELDPQVADFVILRFFAAGGQRVARCVFAEKRAVVYELFAEILHGPSSTS